MIDFSARERGLLSFLAAHDAALSHQVAVFLDESVGATVKLLEELRQTGVVARERVHPEGHGCVRITPAGLDAIGSRAAPPRFTAAYLHSVGVAWLWLLARNGTFGPLDGFWSARQMGSEDEIGGPGAPFALPLGEFGDVFEVRYPDLVLVSQSQRIPLELLLVAPELPRMRAMMRAYAADHRIGGVVYFTADPRLARVVQTVAASLELTPMVHVRRLPPVRLR